MRTRPRRVLATLTVARCLLERPGATWRCSNGVDPRRLSSRCKPSPIFVHRDGEDAFFFPLRQVAQAFEARRQRHFSRFVSQCRRCRSVPVLLVHGRRIPIPRRSSRGGRRPERPSASLFWQRSQNGAFVRRLGQIEVACDVLPRGSHGAGTRRSANLGFGGPALRLASRCLRDRVVIGVLESKTASSRDRSTSTRKSRRLLRSGEGGPYTRLRDQLW